MTLTDLEVSEIRAAAGYYRPSDVARHYEVNPSTIHRIWQNKTRTEIPPGELPNINGKPRREMVKDDIFLLQARGMTVDEIARELNIGRSTVYEWLKVQF